YAPPPHHPFPRAWCGSYRPPIRSEWARGSARAVLAEADHRRFRTPASAFRRSEPAAIARWMAKAVNRSWVFRVGRPRPSAAPAIPAQAILERGREVAARGVSACCREARAVVLAAPALWRAAEDSRYRFRG